MSGTAGIPRPIAILGLGLMGTSLGLALGRRGLADDLVGHDPGPAGARALGRGAVRRLAGSVEDAVDGAGLVVLAVPVPAILGLLPDLARLLRPGTLVTDLGSTKAAICAAAARTLPDGIPFVGGHPMAGGEQAGPDAARADLFSGCAWGLCPGRDTPTGALASARALALAAGAASVIILDPGAHDEAAALISHVPQLLAVELLNVVGGHARRSEALALAGAGYVGMTRTGKSPFHLWEGILASNREAVLEGLRSLRAGLDEVERALAAGREGELALRFRRAAATRKALEGPAATVPEGQDSA